MFASIVLRRADDGNALDSGDGCNDQCQALPSQTLPVDQESALTGQCADEVDVPVITTSLNAQAGMEWLSDA